METGVPEPAALPASGSAPPRPYPPQPVGDGRDVLLAATRALLHADDEQTVLRVVSTAASDLGAALVPARLEPRGALPLDVSLGVGEPVVAVVEAGTVPALLVGRLLPGLLDDARTALRRLRRAVQDGDSVRAATAPDLAHYLALVGAGDGDGAVGLVAALLRAGVSTRSVVQDVLVPAQREVGELWYRGAWSVADEHAATAVAERCLHLLPRPTGPRSVLFVAPEGEWHGLPSHLAAAAAGVRASVLGPGLPAEALPQYLEVLVPDVVALSCTTATALVAAADTVRAAHSAGVPVVAGGRAFGSTPSRALALGADAWLADPADLPDLELPRQLAADVALPREALVADLVPEDLLVLALERHAASSPVVAALDLRERQASLEEMRWLTRHAAAAVACGDPTVVVEAVAWLRPLLAARDLPAHVLDDAVHQLADALQPELATVAGLLRHAAAH